MSARALKRCLGSPGSPPCSKLHRHVRSEVPAGPIAIADAPIAALEQQRW